jgi:multidrug resistance efflux pump
MTKGTKMFDKAIEFIGLAETSKWKQERKYVVRRNVFFSVALAVVLVAVWQVSANLWWTENGYCWGDMIECYFPEEGK